MELDESQIASKEQVGWLGEDPVFEMETKGGRSYVLALRRGKLLTLGVGPHRGVALSIAGRVAKGIHWIKLEKSVLNVDEGGRVYAKWLEVTRRLRGE